MKERRDETPQGDVENFYGHINDKKGKQNTAQESCLKDATTHISSINHLAVALSMIDAIVFAFAFSMTTHFIVELKFSLRDILLSITIAFGSPTAWLLPLL